MVLFCVPIPSHSLIIWYIRKYFYNRSAAVETELHTYLYSILILATCQYYRNEDNLTKAVMANYERRCTSLQAENRSLRDMLSDMFEELNSIIPRSPTKSPRRGKNLQPSLL